MTSDILLAPSDEQKLQRLRRPATELIGGIPVAALTRQETADAMINLALAVRGLSPPPVVFSSANGQVLSAVARVAQAAHAKLLMEGAHVISADGQPIVFASRLLGENSVRERCATTDLFHDVARLAVVRNVTFYVLGSTEAENNKATQNVRRMYPGLKIVGSHHGYFSNEEEEEKVVKKINKLAPDIVWVCLGFPREQEFCIRWRPLLTRVGILKTAGGLLNYLSGTCSRAPGWMQSAGLEWAYRLALEPRRLFARYMVTNVHAAWLLATKTARRPHVPVALTSGESTMQRRDGDASMII